MSRFCISGSSAVFGCNGLLMIVGKEGIRVFFAVGVLFILLGGLLLWKAERMAGRQSFRIMTGTGGVLLAASGAAMVYFLLSGKIQLPLF